MRIRKTGKNPEVALVKSAPLHERILTVRGTKVILDADLAELYAITTKALNQAVKRNPKRFPGDFTFLLTAKEKRQVVTNCDHLLRLKFSPVLPRAFTEHGALMAASLLNSPRAVAMSLYVIRAFVKMRERLAADDAILIRLGGIDKTLLLHDSALRDIYHKLRPLLAPPPEPPKPGIGFHIKEDAVPYRVKRRLARP